MRRTKLINRVLRAQEPPPKQREWRWQPFWCQCLDRLCPVLETTEGKIRGTDRRYGAGGETSYLGVKR